MARWARLAVVRILPGDAFARQDLGLTVWSLGVLGVAPDAATAALVVAKVAGVARRERGKALRGLRLPGV